MYSSLLLHFLHRHNIISLHCVQVLIDSNREPQLLQDSLLNIDIHL
jgi:hypothetical protein